MIPIWLTGTLLAAAALVMFATNILITKAAADKVSLSLGFLISVSVNLAFSAILFVIELLFRRTVLEMNIGAIGLFLLAGICSTYLGRWFFFESVVRLGSAKASIFQVSSPAFAAAMAWIFLSEALAYSAVVGIMITIFGLAVVSYKPTIHRQANEKPHPSTGKNAKKPIKSLPHFFRVRFDIILGIGSSMAYAVGTLLRGGAIRLWNEPILGALLGAAAGLVLYTITGPNLSTISGTFKEAERRGLWLYAFSGLLTISAQICAIWSFRFIPISISNLITLCTPLIVIPAGYLFFKTREQITIRMLLGGLFALMGIALTVTAAK